MDLIKNLVLVLVISVVSGSPLYKTEVHVKSGGTDVIPLGYLDYAPQFQLLMMPQATYGSLPPPCPSPCLVGAVNADQELPLTSANIRAFQPGLAQLALAARNSGYEYSYLIYDEETGDQKSHHEKKDGSLVRGQYSLKQPDGIIREVHYTAGSDGFNAEVKNIHPNEPCESHGHEHGPHNVEPHTEEHHSAENSSEEPHIDEHSSEDHEHGHEHENDHEHGPEHEPEHEHEHEHEHENEHEHGNEHEHEPEHEHEHDHEEHEHPAEIIDIEIKKEDEPHSEDLKLEIKHDEEGTSIKSEELLETTDEPEETSVSTEVLEPVIEPIIAPHPPQIFLSLQDIIRCAHKSAAQRGHVQSSPLTYIILGGGGPC